MVAAATEQIHLPTRCKGKQLKIKTFPPKTSFYLGFHWKKDAAHFGEDSSRKYPYRHTQRRASWLNSDPGKLMNKGNYQKCVPYPMPSSSIYCFGGTCSEMSSKSKVHGSGRWLNQQRCLLSEPEDPSSIPRDPSKVEEDNKSTKWSPGLHMHNMAHVLSHEDIMYLPMH